MYICSLRQSMAKTVTASSFEDNAIVALHSNHAWEERGNFHVPRHEIQITSRRLTEYKMPTLEHREYMDEHSYHSLTRLQLNARISERI